LLRIGVICAYAHDDWHARRIAEAAARADHVDVLAPTDFAAEIAGGRSRVTVRGGDASQYDLYLTPRALGDEGDADVQLELYRVLTRAGAQLINDVDALLVAIDKFRTSWELARAGLATPDARVVQTPEQARAALEALGNVVVKPVYGSLGLGVERVGGPAQAARLDELLAARGALYLQRFVDGAELDLRAFVVGDRVAAAVARRPRAGDFRGNADRGSTTHVVSLDDDSTELALAATRAVGLDYSGVDIIVGANGPEVLEVNGTPSFRNILETTGRDMAPLIVEHAIKAVQRRRQNEWRKAE
jgi:tetrahydromethanopterin:alpha-L-glutamate ligase